MVIKKVKIWILWDVQDGYSYNRFYLNPESAEIGLQENYTDYWITSGKAKIEEKIAVDYTGK